MFAYVFVVVPSLSSYLTLCDPKDCSMPASSDSVLGYLPEFAQIHHH